MSAGPGVRLAFRLGADGRIAEARFQTAAFDAARPIAAALCEALVGATVQEAGRISANAMARLAQVPEGSAAARTVFFAKCASLMPFLGRAAYAGSGITCTCFGIETETIRRTIRKHRLKTVDDIRRHLPATSGCGTCRPEIVDLLDQENAL